VAIPWLAPASGTNNWPGPIVRVSIDAPETAPAGSDPGGRAAPRPPRGDPPAGWPPARQPRSSPGPGPRAQHSRATSRSSNGHHPLPDGLRGLVSLARMSTPSPGPAAAIRLRNGIAPIEHDSRGRLIPGRRRGRSRRSSLRGLSFRDPDRVGAALGHGAHDGALGAVAIARRPKHESTRPGVCSQHRRGGRGSSASGVWACHDDLERTDPVRCASEATGGTEAPARARPRDIGSESQGPRRRERGGGFQAL